MDEETEGVQTKVDLPTASSHVLIYSVHFMIPSDDEIDAESSTTHRIKISGDVVNIPIATSLAGMMIGFARGSRMSALKFLAENAHRAPTTVQGWYFYNKTKNYRVLLGGFKGAGREALKLGAVGCGWVAFEQSWKSLSNLVGSGRLSEAKDVVAGGGTAAVVSLICEWESLEVRGGFN